MPQETELSDASGLATSNTANNGQPGHQRRPRVLLSCAPCRVSKLKCDRSMPCANCLRKGLADACEYAPRPRKQEKQKKGMSARLQRLEGMLREMIADETRASMSGFGEARHPASGVSGGSNGVTGSGVVSVAAQLAAEARQLDESEGGAEGGDMRGGGGGRGRGRGTEPRERDAGRVVMGEHSATYVGATHFMAMLDDIEDLKSYFEDSPSEELNLAEGEEDCPDEAGCMANYLPLDLDSPESLLLGLSSRLASKNDLLSCLPPQAVMDRLIARYFSSGMPSVVVNHRPTFAKQYSLFCRDPSQANTDWIGLLFAIMSMGIYYIAISRTDDKKVLREAMGGMSFAELFKTYRSATAWTLTARKLANPTMHTVQSLLIFVESEFLVNRATQATCWQLSGLAIRLMMQMGMHRDPSKLPTISAFDGEMRRRMWNLIIQLDLIVSFHMGLPSMIHGIPSDTSLPSNLLDDDFSEDSPELPPPRPDSEYTGTTYAIYKSMICRVFGQVARFSHMLTTPSYADVMRIDGMLLEKWHVIPDFMRVRPLRSDAVLAPPMQIIQRFGIASLFQKSRCVLHRPYLTVAVPRPEHAYSRRTCLQAALELLSYHESIFEATQPGGILHDIGWFVTGLGMHDFLLAAMIVYLVVQNDGLFDEELVISDSRASSLQAESRAAEPEWATPSVSSASFAATPHSASTGQSSLSGQSGSGQTGQSAVLPHPTATFAQPLPIARSTLIELLGRSYQLWAAISTNHMEVRKAADLLKVMVSKIQAQEQQATGVVSTAATNCAAATAAPPTATAAPPTAAAPTTFPSTSTSTGRVGVDRTDTLTSSCMGPPALKATAPATATAASFSTANTSMDSQVPSMDTLNIGGASMQGIDFGGADILGDGTADMPAGMPASLDLAALDMSTPQLADVQMDLSRRDLVPRIEVPGDAAIQQSSYESWMGMSLGTLDWDMVDSGLIASSTHPANWFDEQLPDSGREDIWR